MTATDRPVRVGLGRRGGWSGLVAGMTLIGLLEAAVLHFVTEAFAPQPVTVAIDTLVGALTAFFVLAVASPLWSTHRVTDDRLRLRFGWLAAMDVPLSAIRAVAPHHPTIGRPAQLGLDFDVESSTLSLIGSPTSPLLRIDLTDHLPARTQVWRRVRAISILVSTDAPDLLTTALTAAHTDQ